MQPEPLKMRGEEEKEGYAADDGHTPEGNRECISDIVGRNGDESKS